LTINKRYLNNYEKSMRIYISEEQKAAILERFGTEPEPYGWTEQDIAIQTRNFLECGEFFKKAPGDFEPVNSLSDDVEF